MSTSCAGEGQKWDFSCVEKSLDRLHAECAEHDSLLRRHKRFHERNNTSNRGERRDGFPIHHTDQCALLLCRSNRDSDMGAFQPLSEV